MFAPTNLKAPSNSIAITYGRIMDDGDMVNDGHMAFSVILVEETERSIVLWRGGSYDEAIHQAEHSLAAHLPFRPELAGFGVIDMVGGSTPNE